MPVGEAASPLSCAWFRLASGPWTTESLQPLATRPLPLPSRFKPFPCMGASLVAGSGKVEGTSGENGRTVGGDTVDANIWMT